jgi:hypothetical protein
MNEENLMRDEDFKVLLGAVRGAVEHYHERKQDLRTIVLPAAPESMKIAKARKPPRLP